MILDFYSHKYFILIRKFDLTGNRSILFECSDDAVQFNQLIDLS